MENKRPRALEYLREEFVEKRRKKYLENLESFTEFDSFEYSFNNTDFSIQSKIPVDPTIFDEYSVNQTDINEILVFPEFITCLDSLISEEVALIKESLFFVRPEGSRALIYIKNNFATVYNKEGTVKNYFKIGLKGLTILDCVYYKSNSENTFKSSNGIKSSKLHIYYVLDILLLNGCILTTSELQCRLFFLNSILDELNTSTNALFQLVNYYEFDSKRLESIYNSKYIESESVICKLYNINNELYTFDRVFVGKAGDEFKEKIVRIAVTDFKDFKVSYRIVGEGKSYKNPDTLRKIYVNYVNHKRANTDFGKILKYL
ncbi:conserved hypothetical protein [Theileria orientalis strain Shintoku]|uniref:Snurportin-1 n=1 Tax=Theileria orientalis strain Shintoku TaxID=869250 RepID=J4CCM1_THEOR|nr:conserved hypothetical protein [Theileria orientalis strain Shintoku]BAM39632.1 conserved hypothetical protein [Theileria orientalis strain Shintoku]|eukprot:XP_009689933.1 conserved hypothetical protein [Theileria orientalis strain Shintoku]